MKNKLHIAAMDTTDFQILYSVSHHVFTEKGNLFVGCRYYIY